MFWMSMNPTRTPRNKWISILYKFCKDFHYQKYYWKYGLNSIEKSTDSSLKDLWRVRWCLILKSADKRKRSTNENGYDFHLWVRNEKSKRIINIKNLNIFKLFTFKISY